MQGVEGYCHPDFAAVRDAFAENFERHGELGAGVAIFRKGKCVVDLWGGLRDRERALPWERDTLCNMMSVAKGVVTLCLAQLVERKLLSLDAPVARYWPEFASEGKGGVTVRQAMGHLACIPVTDLAREGDYYDYERMIAAIAGQKPVWPIGSVQVYHSSTLGFIAAEILRRITGKTIGRYLRENVTGPLGADYRIGLTEAEAGRCATIVPSRRNSVNAAKAMPPEAIEARIWKALPKDETYNSSAWRRSEIPSVNGHGTARGVARIYGALANGGAIDGVQVVDMNALAPFREEQKPTQLPDGPLRLRMAVGFMLNTPPHRAIGPNMDSFGHSGAGGAQAFCDPVAGLGFCYCTNLMQDGTETGVRASSLINAAYRR